MTLDFNYTTPIESGSNFNFGLGVVCQSEIFKLNNFNWILGKFFIYVAPK